MSPAAYTVIAVATPAAHSGHSEDHATSAYSRLDAKVSKERRRLGKAKSQE